MLKDALLIVDVQNDFCPGGTLAVPEGDKVVEPINCMIEYASKKGWPIFASRDWHPVRTTHFKEYGGPWPAHCIQGVRGAEFHPRLAITHVDSVISKGMEYDDDAYSAFQGRCLQGELDATLDDFLSDWEVEKIYVCGLATDYCVRESVLDALNLGYHVVVLEDAIRAVSPETGARAIREMKDAGAIFTTTDFILNFVVPNQF